MKNRGTMAHASGSKTLFAEFGVRVFGVGLDLLIIMFIAQGVQTYILQAVGLSEINFRATGLAISFFYFASFWASPLRATPAQLLLGMCVIGDRSGSVLAGLSSVALYCLD